MSAAASSGWPPAVAHSPAQWPSLSSSFLREEGEGGCGRREGRQGRVGRGGVGGGGGAGQGEWEGLGGGAPQGAPAARRLRTMSTWPCSHASIRGVTPLRSCGRVGGRDGVVSAEEWAFGRSASSGETAGSGRTWWPGSAPSRRSASTASTSPAEAARRRRREAMKTSLRPLCFRAARRWRQKARAQSLERRNSAADETREPRFKP